MLSVPRIAEYERHEKVEKSVHFNMLPYKVGIRPPPVQIVIDNASSGEEDDPESEGEFVDRTLNKQNSEYLRSIMTAMSEKCQPSQTSI